MLLSAVALLVACHDQEILDRSVSTKGEPGVIYLSPVGKKIVTRAGSSEYEEGLIHNAYVMLFKLDNVGDVQPTTEELSAASIVARWSVEGKDLGFNYTTGYKFQTYITQGFLAAFDHSDRFFFAAVCNYGKHNSIMKLDEDELEILNTYLDLEKVNVNMRENSFSHERGSNFLMSGHSFGVLSLTDMNNLMLNPDANPIKVDLKRVDSKVRFHLDASKLENQYNNYPGVSEANVELLRWRANNLPTGTVLMESSYIKEYAHETTLHNTDWMNFEGIGDVFNEELTFYVLPRAYLRKQPNTDDSDPQKFISIRELTNTPAKLGISSDGSYTDLFTDAEKKDVNHKIAHFSYELRKAAAEEIINNEDNYDPATGMNDPNRNKNLRKLRYGLREKQNKIAVDSTNYMADGILQNGAYTVAPSHAPYLEFEGRMTYKTADGVTHITEVRYTIHLGYAGIDNIYSEDSKKQLGLDEATLGYSIEEEDDYFTRRNVYYDYNAWVTGHNDIMLEVESHEGLTDPDADNPYLEDGPGAEGEILEYTQHIRVSSANSQHVLHLDLDKLMADSSARLTWVVSSPYGEFADVNPMGTPPVPGMPYKQTPISLADHNWIKFMVNRPANGVVAASENHRVFLGEREAPLNYYQQNGSDANEQYTRTVANAASPTDGGDRYGYYHNDFQFNTVGAVKAYLEDYDAGIELMLNPRQMNQLFLMFIADLPHAMVGNSAYAHNLIKDNRKPHITIFVEEYYYDRVPIGANAGKRTFNSSTDIAKFISARDRRFAFVNDFKYSHDTESRYMTGYIGITQPSIQSIYAASALGATLDQSDWSQNDMNSYIGNSMAYDGNTQNVGFGMDGTRIHYDVNKDGLDNEPLKTHPNILGEGYAKTQGKATSRKSGLQNSQIIARTKYGWGKPVNNYKWSEFIDLDKWQLKSTHNQTINQFMLSNRDENGNGVLDLYEIKWYLPAIDQYLYTEIGKNATTVESYLYSQNGMDGIKNETYGGLSKIYLTSTNTNKPGGYSTYWANGGGDTGVQEYNSKGEPNTGSGGARCYSHSFRNIGVPTPDIADAKGQVSYVQDRVYYAVDLNDETLIPLGKQMVYGGGVVHPLIIKNISEYLPPVLISERKPISDGGAAKYAYEYHSKYLDSRAFRTYYQVANLPLHNHFSTHNAPRRRFQVMSFKDYDMAKFDIFNAQMHRNNKEYRPQHHYFCHIANLNPSDDPCPPGWRMPNQKEFIMVQITKPNVRNASYQGPDKYDWWVDGKTMFDSYTCGTFLYTGADANVEKIINHYSKSENPQQYGYIVNVHSGKYDGLTTNVNAVPGGMDKTYYGIRSNNLDHASRVLPVRDME